ncbi:hypothetical protein C0Q70_10972 [Pomacea canaliculata]|uniref:Uncharacterized protein n=1 Tax=Pomacea canaliculata TaxID=400727 RepID=A0A2T7P4M9_POMCA|nr:hypothetical protein C0Q70_10972 [Pomacea canaliculata]
MLRCSCNGPSPQNKSICQEEVIATKEILNACGQVTNSAIVEVQYRCVPGTEIIDMCGDTNWTSNGQRAAAFLATPHFSNPPVLNAHCMCNITGKALQLQILELRADIDSVMGDSLNITASDGDVWSSSNFCKRCHVEKFNEVVYHSVKNYSELTVNFQDNHRPGQRVWLEIQGGSQTLAISCHATITTPKELTTSTLPATITAAPMRTTYSTDAMTTILMTKTTYSAVKASPTIGVLPHITSTKSASTLKDSDVLTSTTALLTHRQTENSSSKEQNSEEVPRVNRLNHNDTMSDSPLVGSPAEVLCQSQSENTLEKNVESNHSQTGILGNSSAMNPKQAHNTFGYASSNCTFQTDMEDAVKDFHMQAPDLKHTFCNSHDDFGNVTDGNSSLLKQDREDADLEKPTGMHDAFLQEENQRGNKCYGALEQENKERAYSAEPLQQQGTKEKKSTSQTPLHREEASPSEKLTRNKNIGGRKLAITCFKYS